MDRSGEVIAADTPCPACGYNLRGLPRSVACPECGDRSPTRPRLGRPSREARLQVTRARLDSPLLLVSASILAVVFGLGGTAADTSILFRAFAAMFWTLVGVVPLIVVPHDLGFTRHVWSLSRPSEMSEPGLPAASRHRRWRGIFPAPSLARVYAGAHVVLAMCVACNAAAMMIGRPPFPELLLAPAIGGAIASINVSKASLLLARRGLLREEVRPGWAPIALFVATGAGGAMTAAVGWSTPAQRPAVAVGVGLVLVSFGLWWWLLREAKRGAV